MSDIKRSRLKILFLGKKSFIVFHKDDIFMNAHALSRQLQLRLLNSHTWRMMKILQVWCGSFNIQYHIYHYVAMFTVSLLHPYPFASCLIEHWGIRISITGHSSSPSANLISQSDHLQDSCFRGDFQELSQGYVVCLWVFL